VREFFISGQADINGAHALIRFCLLLIVLAAIVWKLRERSGEA
jgi:hypothetical protein